jgi:cytochrome P450
MTATIAERPAHVPPELVVDFDYSAPSGHEEDVHLAWHRLHDDGVPDIFWTPRYGGHWVATRADDIDHIQTEYTDFSFSSVTIPSEPGNIPLVPLELDPPEHALYRNLLTPRFGPKQVQSLKEDIGNLTNALIDNFQNRGECEFVSEFAKRLPVDIFLAMVDLPLEDRDELLAMTEMSVRPSNPQERLEASQRLFTYVQYWIEQRRADPGSDLFSLMVNATIDGQRISDERTFGLLQNVLFGGLDTVASALSFITRFLAENPAHRRQLVEQPTLISQGIEELLRRFGIPQTARVVTRDMEYKGVQFKQGEQIQLSKTLHGLDERRYPKPLNVDFNRRPRDHAAFGAGVHRCIGAGLARRELQIFLEEWLRRIPDFEIKSGEKPVTSSGKVNGVLYLPLSW